MSAYGALRFCAILLMLNNPSKEDQMATTPQPTPKPAPTPTPQQPKPTPPTPTPPRPGAPVRSEDPPVKTVGQEQMERSQEIHDKGVEPWKKEHDERKGPQRQVAGVSRTAIDDGEEYPGTPTTPPEGHTERQPAPGEPGGPSAGHHPMPGEDGAQNEADLAAKSKR